MKSIYDVGKHCFRPVFLQLGVAGPAVLAREFSVNHFLLRLPCAFPSSWTVPKIAVIIDAK